MSRICVVVLDHRNDEYLRDLVGGIQVFCPEVDIALYYSGEAPVLAGTPASGLYRLPGGRPLRYAKVTPFFLDLIEWTTTTGYEYVVNAETDMAFVQHGFEGFVANALRNVDYLSPGLTRHTPRTSRWRPYHSLRPELPELLSILDLTYTNGCFSPGQVFSSRFAEQVVRSRCYDELRDFVARNQDENRSFSLQEVLLPTIADALGLRAAGYPAHLRTTNRYRPYHAAASVARAQETPDAYFVHPVRRDPSDPARQAVRALVRPAAVG